MVYDRDPAGEEGARRMAAALRDAGLRAVAPELPEWLGEGADVDLLHRAAGERLREELEALPALKRRMEAGAFGERSPLVTLADLLQEPPEEISYIVDGLLPAGGASLLNGKPKVGKPTLARSIALAVARGEPVLGRSTLRRLVLYLVLEEKRAEVAGWFRRAGATTEQIVLYVGARVEDPVPFLRRGVRRRDIRLVIVDPSTRC